MYVRNISVKLQTYSALISHSLVFALVWEFHLRYQAEENKIHFLYCFGPMGKFCSLQLLLYTNYDKHTAGEVQQICYSVCRMQGDKNPTHSHTHSLLHPYAPRALVMSLVHSVSRQSRRIELHSLSAKLGSELSAKLIQYFQHDKS